MTCITVDSSVGCRNVSCQLGWIVSKIWKGLTSGGRLLIVLSNSCFWVDLQHLKFPYDGLMVAQKVEKVDDVSVKQLHEVLRMEI